MSAQAGFAAALLDPRAPAPAGLRAWNGSDVARRIDVHRNNVMVSLTRALADAFPVVRALVGDAFFAAMAAVFVREQPPRSPVLAAYGAGFPAFIEGFAPARPVACLADVARLEMARLEAFHAADAPAVSGSALRRALAPDADIAQVQLQPHPSLRLVVSRHAACSVWAAHQQEGALESVTMDRAEAALVIRPALEVLVVPIALAAAPFFDGLLQGRPLGACAAAAAADPGFALADTLVLLLRHGALAGIHLRPGASP